MPSGSAAATATTRSAAAQGRQGRGIASRTVQVAHDLLVALERGGDIDDGVVGPLAARGERGGDAARAELGPARRTVQAGEHVDAGAAERRADPRQLARVQPAELGLPARGRESGRLVGETERQGDRRRVGVGIDQPDVPTAARQLDGELDRERRAAGRAGRTPHGDDPRARGSGVGRHAATAHRRGGEALGELPRLDAERQRRLQTERRGEALVAGLARRAGRCGRAPRSHDRHDRGVHGRARRLEHHGVGVGERTA